MRSPRRAPSFSRPRRALQGLAALLVVLLAAGCQARWPRGRPAEPVEWAESSFSQSYSCPADRLAAREREDIPVHRFACQSPDAEWTKRSHAGTELWRSRSELRDHCVERPPEDVAGDPARLALWRRLQVDEGWAGRIDGIFTPPIEVTGCGEHRFYACQRSRTRSVVTVYCEGIALIDLGAREPPAER